MAAGFSVFSSSLKPEEFLKLKGEKKTDRKTATFQSGWWKPRFPCFWQVAGVNVQPWLCWTLPQLHIFPPHSLFLIMFARSMEPQLIMLHVCVSPWTGISGGGVSTVSAVLSRMQNKAWCDVDYCWTLWSFHHCWIYITDKTEGRCCGFRPSIRNQDIWRCFSSPVKKSLASHRCCVFSLFCFLLHNRLVLTVLSWVSALSLPCSFYFCSVSRHMGHCLTDRQTDY